VRRPVGQRGSRSGTLRAELAKKAAVVGSVRVVLEVARTGSFSAAAERLGYTQSAVSRQVAVTEKAAGAPLFERHARGVRLTAAGEVLARHARKVLDGVGAAGVVRRP
jgi:DNA-binding transcriptional LysR family regulator